MNSLHRRKFIAAAAAGSLSSALAGGKGVPLVPLAGKKITRLVAGGNPIAGFSHSTLRLSELMMQYFTVERTTDFLLHCEAEGINTFQCSYNNVVRDSS